MSVNRSSLVGYGLSSDSDSDAESNEGTIEETADDGGGDESRKGTGQAERTGRNFLLESGSGSSSSDSEPEQEVEDGVETPAAVPAPRIPAPTAAPPPDSQSVAPKLPPPLLGVAGQPAGAIPAGSSVFANPYRERAEEHLNVLRKHVPLTLESRPSQIGGRKMCIAYRKDGRCRFGISCKFAHDSDLQTSEGRGPGAEGTLGNLATPNPPFPPQQCPDQEGDPEEGAGRKRRVGLSNTLIPPKRALKQYATQREKERVAPS
ncbi:hypothetical protein GJAV_G00065860 [Gymnothorax javanicus]|nr:hypothetical protein GJAV_G00065860 [Gymnothorax javanicus]